MTKSELCSELLREFEIARKKHETDGYHEGGQELLRQKFEMTISAGEPLLFVLPAFPFKSQNVNNTLGKLPDYGEVVALSALQGMCKRMSDIHPAGARMVLASDGRLYADLVGVSDQDVLEYRDELLRMYRGICEKQEFLSWYSLDEAFPLEATGDAKRQALMKRYPQDQKNLMEIVHRDPDYNRVYVGFKNAMISELSVDGTHSRRSVEKEASRIARLMLERNFANAALIREKFPGYVRLSIKHHNTCNGIFGVNLLPGHDDVGTPWLNVLIELKGGKLVYAKRRDAEARGYALILNQDRPYFYQECG